MNESLRSERVAAALLQTLARSQDHHDDELPDDGGMHCADFTIAFSSQAGSAGCMIAREIGARLGWSVYDHELIELMAQALHLRPRLLDEIDERPRSWLLETVEAFGGAEFVNQATYVKQLIKTLATLAARGRCIVIGRGAAHLLPASSTIRVRVVASFSDRVQTICREQNFTETEATKFLQKVDSERRQFMQDHFRRDPTDLSRYDLGLNSSYWSISECANQVIHALEQRRQAAAESHAPSEARVMAGISGNW